MSKVLSFHASSWPKLESRKILGIYPPKMFGPSPTLTERSIHPDTTLGRSLCSPDQNL